MRVRFFLAVSVLLGACVLGSGASACDPEGNPLHIIPVLVNICSGDALGDTPEERLEEAQQAIQEANRILRAGACIGLQPTFREHCPQTGEDVGASDAEQAGVVAEGEAEIAQNADGRGIKIWLHDFITDGVGFAKHDKPSASVQADDAGEEDPPEGEEISEADTTRGKRIAHEIIHVLTIKGHSGSAGSVMRKREPAGETIDPEIIDEIQDGAGKRAKARALKDSKQRALEYGYTYDPGSSNPAAPAHDDVTSTTMSRAGSSAQLRCEMYLGQIVPSNVVQEYRLLLDTDSNAQTGGEFAGFNGIDKILLAEVSLGVWKFSMTDGDGTSKKSVLGAAHSEPLIRCAGQTDPELNPVDIFTRLEWLVTVNDVSWGEGDVFPAQAVVGGSGSIADTHAVSFDRAASSRGPQINVDGPVTGLAPNDPLLISGSGLTPNCEFEVRFEDKVLYLGTADSEGEMTAEVSVPGEAISGVALVFVKEVASVDAFDFVVIKVE